MSYKEYKELAKQVTSYEEADALIKEVSYDETISYRQYASIRYIALESACEA